MSSAPHSIEATIIVAVRWTKLGVEIFGAGLVALGVCAAIVHLVRIFAARTSVVEFTTTRLILARYLALALEFELGADILGTAVSPTWEQIGKLGVVAVIRTGLNFFLSIEMNPSRAVENPKATSRAFFAQSNPTNGKQQMTALEVEARPCFDDVTGRPTTSGGSPKPAITPLR